MRKRRDPVFRGLTVSLVLLVVAAVLSGTAFGLSWTVSIPVYAHWNSMWLFLVTVVSCVMYAQALSVRRRYFAETGFRVVREGDAKVSTSSDHDITVGMIFEFCSVFGYLQLIVQARQAELVVIATLAVAAGLFVLAALIVSLWTSGVFGWLARMTVPRRAE